MADAFYAVTSFQTVQVSIGNTVQDVEYVTCATIPTGIGFSYPVALSTWRADSGVQVLGAIATELENLATFEHVVGGDAVQTIDVNGLLADASELVVEYDRSARGLPPLQGTVTIPLSLIVLLEAEQGLPVPPGTLTPAQIVGAEYQRLAALAAA